VNTVIQAAMGGATATTVLEGDRQFGLVVRAQPDQRASVEDIGNIKVGYQTPSGATAYIPLRELATITEDTGASYIYHETTKRYIPVKFSVRGRDLAGAVAEAQARIVKNVKLPPGYRLVWAGEFNDLKLAQQRLAIIVPVSLGLIMVLLYSLFNSLRDSLLALTGIPFAVAGGALALFVTGLNLSISADIGFISLFGVSVMNGILMITYYNQTVARGVVGVDAMFHAAEQRMRPLLMTALSACIGLLPAALSHGIGSQVQRPLAVVVVGGMLIAPIMLLIVTPALMSLLMPRKAPSSEPAPREPAPAE
jgi:cobalt-zinc-cadmium resistance protein CzcA